MKSVIRKLQSQTGASLSFALLLFLVCTVISSIAIVSATAVSGRVSEMTDMDQRYYSVTSAAELLRALVDGKEVTIVEKTVKDPDPTAPSEKIYQYIFDTDDKKNYTTILDDLIEVDDSTLELGSSLLLNYRFTKDLTKDEPTDDPGSAVESIVKEAAYTYYSKKYLDSVVHGSAGSPGNQQHTFTVVPTESDYTGILNATVDEWLMSNGTLIFEVSSPEDAKKHSYALELNFNCDFNSRSFSSSSTKLSTKVIDVDGVEKEESTEITVTTTIKIVTYTWKLASINTIDQITD